MASDYVAVADSEVRLRSLAHSVLVVFFAFLVGGGVLAPLADVIGPLLGYSVDPPAVVVSGLRTVLQFVGFFAVIAAYVISQDERPLIDYRRPTLRDVGFVVVGLVGILVASRVVEAVVAAFGVESAQNQVVQQGTQNPELFLLMIPITILFVGPAEELLFRGVVQGLFRRAYGALPGIVAASALFGLVHYVALVGDGKLTYVAVAVVLGLVLGVLYELSENVVVPAVVHGLFNATIFASLWLEQTGGASLPV